MAKANDEWYPGKYMDRFKQTRAQKKIVQQMGDAIDNIPKPAKPPAPIAPGDQSVTSGEAKAQIQSQSSQPQSQPQNQTQLTLGGSSGEPVPTTTAASQPQEESLAADLVAISEPEKPSAPTGIKGFLGRVSAEPDNAEAKGKKPPAKATGPVVGKLRVHILRAKNLAPRPERVRARQTYVSLFFEGQIKTTPIVQGTAPVWCKEGQPPDPKACFEFDVTDLTTDLQLLIMDDRKLVKDPVMGQVIIPLASFYTKFDVLPTKTEWHELFPAPEPHLIETTSNKLFAAEHTVKGAGMARPKHSLGFLQVECELTLSQAIYTPPMLPRLAAALLLSQPYSNPAEFPFEPSILKRDIVRIKRQVGAPHWLQFILEVISWKYPPQSIAGLAAWIYLCLYGALWLYFPVFVLLILYGGYRANKARASRMANLVSWDEDALRDPNLPVTIPEKLKKVKDIVFRLQQLLAKVASHLERSSNMLSWADRRLTAILSCIIIGITLPLSLLLYVVPIHLIFLVLGFFAFTQPYLAKRRSRKGPKEPTKLSQAIKNIIGRVPDGLEETNRIFAERATASSSRLPVESLLGLERPE